jgi:integrase
VTNKEKVRKAIVEGRRKANAEAQALGYLHLVKPDQAAYEVSGAERIVLARATKLKGHQVRQALDEDERLLLDFLIATMVRHHEARMAKYSDLIGTTLTIHGKQYKTRTVEISQRLALAIRERGEAATKNGGSELWFPNGSGRPNTHLLNDLQRLAQRAGAKFDTGLHKLRKTGASRRYRAGEPLATLMQELGHQDLSATQRHLSDVKPEPTKRAARPLLRAALRAKPRSRKTR